MNHDSPYYFTTDRYRVVTNGEGVREIVVATPERLPTYPDCSGELGVLSVPNPAL